MINRVRDIRRQKALTLADVAERCSPPTTAQTIGRLETGMRQLSLTWMNRIAAALEVDPELLVRGADSDAPSYVARLTADGAEPLPAPRDALLPSALASEGVLVALAIECSAGEYRAGDQVCCGNWGQRLTRACSTAMCWCRAPAGDLRLAG